MVEDVSRTVCLQVERDPFLEVTVEGRPAYLRWIKGVQDKSVPMFVHPPGQRVLPDIVQVRNGALAFSPRVFQVLGPSVVLNTAPLDCFGIPGWRLGAAWSASLIFRMNDPCTFATPLRLCSGVEDLDGRLFESLLPLPGGTNLFVSPRTWARMVSTGLTGCRKAGEVVYRRA